MSNIAYPAIAPDEPGFALTAFELFEQYLTSRSAPAPVTASIKDVSEEPLTAAMLTRAAQYRALFSRNPHLAKAISHTLHGQC